MCAPAVGSPPGFRRDVRHCHPQAVQVLSTPTNSTGIKRVAIVVWVGHDISCMISPVPMNYSCLWRWVQKWREKLKKKANLLASSSHFVSAPLLVPLLSSAPSLFLSPFLCSPCLLLSFSFPSERFLYSYQPPTSVLSSFLLHPLLSPFFFSPSVFSFYLLFLSSHLLSIFTSLPISFHLPSSSPLSSWALLSALFSFPVSFPPLSSPCLLSSFPISFPLFTSAPYCFPHLIISLLLSLPPLPVPSSPLLILTCPASWPFSVSIIQLPLSLHTYEDTHTHIHVVLPVSTFEFHIRLGPSCLLKYLFRHTHTLTSCSSAPSECCRDGRRGSKAGQSVPMAKLPIRFFS